MKNEHFLYLYYYFVSLCCKLFKLALQKYAYLYMNIHIYAFVSLVLSYFILF